MKPDEFEQKLSRQPLRPLPPGWRGEILAAAHAALPSCHPSPVTRHPWLSTLHSQLSAFLWPHPKAWAGLAAVWIFIAAVNFSARDIAPRRAENSLPPSPEVMVELKKQQRMFAELVGSRETADAEQPRIFLPRPRSGRMEVLTV